MAKVSKTYRFPEEVIQVIECRDKRKYPTANEYVEQVILEAAERRAPDREESEMLKEMQEIKQEVQEMKQLLDAMKLCMGMSREMEGGLDYSFPDL